MNLLTVSDIERLAKAGVTIKFDDIMNQVIQDPFVPEAQIVTEQRYQSRMYPLVDAFWERWRRANSRPDRFEYEPFGLYAAEVGEQVHVFVHDGERSVVIEDEKCLYPSDALMAKLHLWGKSK